MGWGSKRHGSQKVPDRYGRHSTRRQRAPRHGRVQPRRITQRRHLQVAEDPDAYLGLDKCDTPNGSYVEIDDNGHLAVRMNPDNPTIGDSPLGSGINSNSRSYFDSVFRIANQGKERICVWIDDTDWPTDDDGERRVEFYRGAYDSTGSPSGLEDLAPQSILGRPVGLDVGESTCIGIATNSHGLSTDDRPLESLDDRIELVADVGEVCGITTQSFEYPYFQIDFVYGEPLDYIHGDEGMTYSSEDRLLTWKHGHWKGPLAGERGDRTSGRSYVDSGVDRIEFHENGDGILTGATIEFDVDLDDSTDEVTLSFTSYGSDTEGWDPDEVQELWDATTATYTESGENYELEIDLPPLGPASDFGLD